MTPGLDEAMKPNPRSRSEVIRRGPGGDSPNRPRRSSPKDQPIFDLNDAGAKIYSVAGLPASPPASREAEQ